MNQYSQVQYIKRKDYYDVIIDYSKNGQKFRPPADVKVLHKHLTKTGAISSTHPNFDEDTRKINANFVKESAKAVDNWFGSTF